MADSLAAAPIAAICTPTQISARGASVPQGRAHGRHGRAGRRAEEGRGAVARCHEGSAPLHDAARRTARLAHPPRARTSQRRSSLCPQTLILHNSSSRRALAPNRLGPRAPHGLHATVPDAARRAGPGSGFGCLLLSGPRHAGSPCCVLSLRACAATLAARRDGARRAGGAHARRGACAECSGVQRDG